MEVETADNNGTANADGFDFDRAPDPPQDFAPRLQWSHRNWDKIGQTYVSTREVRESYLDCVGFWPTLDRGVPVLLDHGKFRKFCYYAETREDMQADDHPEGYVPISYEGDEEGEKEWKQRQLGTRYNMQYRSLWMTSVVSGKRNQYYIKAVQSCRPDAVQALFDKVQKAKGTDGAITDVLDPNCFERRGKERRGVLAYALDNLYGTKATSANHSKALECLRLVCSLEGTDVNADSWYVSASDGPPLIQAIKNWDVEAVKILLNAGARHSFPDATSIEGQWCNVVSPPYPEQYQTGLHRCVGMATGNAEVFPHHDTEIGIDRDMHAILEMLLASGADVLVEAPANAPEKTALQILEARQLATEDSYPLSVALLMDAEAKAKERAGVNSHIDATPTSYQPTTMTDPESGDWAQITDLDEAMQHEISRYANIYQWGMLKQTSTLLATWPKPPPPPINYQLISFSFSTRYEGYYGVAKTLPGVLDAYKSTAERDKDLDSRCGCIDVQFIQFNDAVNCRTIPLLQYHQSQYCGDPQPANIHPYGRKHFGVKRPGDGLPKTVRKMLGMTIDFYHEDEEDENGESKMVLDKINKAAMLWFDGLQPSRGINLRHLWLAEGVDEQDEEEKMCEIWLNPDLCNEHRFTFGSCGNWARSDMESCLWDHC